jgi:hypothetical protein
MEDNNVIIYEAKEALAEETKSQTISSVELKGVLEGIAARVKSMSVENLSEVKTTRIRLGKIRTSIAKQSKAQRDQYTVLAKANRDIELSLIGIIEPEEDRLKALEDEALRLQEIKAREALIPMREQALNALNDGVEVTKEFLLEMDNDQFVTYLNERTTAKNEKDRLAIEAEKAKLAREAEDRRIADEAAKAERDRIEAKAKADEQARINAEAERKLKEEADAKAKKEQAEKDAQKLIDDAKAEADRIKAEAELKEKARLQAIEDERIAKEKAEADAKAEEARLEKLAKEEQERMEKNKKHANFLKDNNYNPQTDKIDRTGNTFTLYRKVAEVTIN